MRRAEQTSVTAFAHTKSKERDTSDNLAERVRVLCEVQANFMKLLDKAGLSQE